ncbi:MAG: tetratricopeptide repeat protein [Planctomycetota bacterium]
MLRPRQPGTLVPFILVFAGLAAGVLPVSGQVQAPSYKAASALLETGHFADAVVAFERRIHSAGRSYDDLMGLGRALFAQHESSRSMGLFYEASKIHEERAEPWAMVARIEQRKGMLKFRENRAGYETDLIEAGIHFQDAARRSAALKNGESGATGAYHAEAATCFLTAGRYARALAEVDEAKGQHDAKALLNLELASCFLAGKFDRFLRVSDAAIQIGDRRYQHLIRRLEVLVRLERYQAAGEMFAELVPKAAELGRYEPWSILERYWLQGNALAARRRAFEAEARKGADDPLPEFYLSLTYGLASDFEKSAASARRVLKSWPQNASAPRYLVTALLQLGQQAEAHVVIRKALGDHPGDTNLQDSANWVVKAYVDKRDYAAAVSVQELLQAAAPENASFRANYANLLKNLGKLDDAVAIFESLCRTARDTPDRLSSFYNDYGLCLNGVKRIKDAQAAFVMALDHDVSHLDARENLGVLYFGQNRDLLAAAAFEEVVRRSRKAGAKSPRWRSLYYLGQIKNRKRGS